MNLYVAIFTILIARGQVLCDVSDSTSDLSSNFNTFNQRISEMIETLYSILRTCTVESPRDSGSEVDSGDNFYSLLQVILADVEAIKNSLKELKPKTVAEIGKSLDELARSNKTNRESECSFGETELIGSGRSLLQYLQRVDFNVFLGKPSYASSMHPNYKVENAVDGNIATYIHTQIERNPWFYVDLLAPHLIWEITIRLREEIRGRSLVIYVSNSVKFDYDGHPDHELLPQFAEQVPNAPTRELKFTYPGGMCGRYVFVKRSVQKEHLIFSEIQGVGFKF